MIHNNFEAVSFRFKCRWMRHFNARRMHLLIGKNLHPQKCGDSFYFARYSGKAEPQCQATLVEFDSPHKAICAGFVDMRLLLILHSYCFANPILDVCHA
jgi:hypothetical protein